MKSVFSFLALGLVLGTSTPALAAATPEEAQRLTTGLVTTGLTRLAASETGHADGQVFSGMNLNG